jgi:transcriptional regulator with XRE-family HTH domain
MNTVERILDLIKKYNITAKKLAEEAGLSSSAVTEWKSGKANPSYGAVIKISNYFNINPDYLLCKSDHIASDPDIVTIQRLRSKLSAKDREKMMQLLRITFDEAFPKEEGED